MSRKLTEQEIKRRLTEGRNYKRLYFELKARYDKGTTALKTENAQLKARVAEFEEIVEKQSLQIAELQAYIFGKKRKKKLKTQTLISKIRSLASYKRAIPEKNEVTDEKHHSLPNQCSCGGQFVNVTTKTYYEEDIPLPKLTEDYNPKLVTKHTVEYSRCNRCRKKSGAVPTPPCPVILGRNIRLWVCHMTSLPGMSYSQIAHLAKALYNLKLSDGEITNIINKKHIEWLPVYEEIKDGIRASPVKHYDETSWKIQSEKTGEALVMSDATNTDVIYELAEGRGGGYIRKLHGNHPDAKNKVYVTDGYSAYNKLEGIHQLCWAHLYRTSRDLKDNGNLEKSKQVWVNEWHQQFKQIYEELREELEKSYDKEKREIVSKNLWSRIEQLANLKSQNVEDPDKLRRLKAQLLKAGEEKLFACLIHDAPCDNNRAERDIRGLVLKRKRCFGSKTPKGAKSLSTVISVCTTIWRRHHDSYFTALAYL